MAFEAGERFCTFFENASTVAKGLRVPAAIGDFMILDAIRDSGGTAIAVEAERLPGWMRKGASLTGISICPETAACIGAVESLTASGWIQEDERIVMFNCGALQKNVDLFDEHLPVIRADAEFEWSSDAPILEESV